MGPFILTMIARMRETAVVMGQYVYRNCLCRGDSVITGKGQIDE